MLSSRISIREIKKEFDGYLENLEPFKQGSSQPHFHYKILRELICIYKFFNSYYKIVFTFRK